MFNSSGKPLLMGILNITPDSFSDGGRFNNITSALTQVEKMLSDGADIIDIGGESTRPYSLSVSSGEQVQRVIPIIKEIRSQLSTTLQISIDTQLSTVAKLALSEGANIINDISAGHNDPNILKVAANYNCPMILMHIKGTPQTMQDNPAYDNVVSDVLTSLQTSVDYAKRAGIKQDKIILDPGIGFGKTYAHNLKLLGQLNRFVELGYPIMLGTSRKKFLNTITATKKPEDLAIATSVTTALAVMAGVKILRVHDVKENRQALDVAWAIKQASIDAK
ncbi:MAG: dihydropteroate synthase [Gammaproteobacteria bacterium]|nr:dihydropteroate synthase [Gammaproteobacteria bacterium]MBT5222212.1 dihydropteroate synthase [Gammaproteobacteria bacterium]MBT5826586.1 dihydropteroate synthase [Gammaproteobacteria bacterium]MBT6420054.1 dihydropteroate synthase [Gammaproteobacteria bacterium]MBT6577155.1 dihydropteroate synthase [Gammaproteobacteria bacterium]